MTALLVDLSAEFWRAYHATGTGPQAYEVTLERLTDLLYRYPRTVICCEGARPFRHQWYPEYKANRPPKPEDAKESLREIIDEVKASALPTLQVDGYEADDLIATLATTSTEDVVILSRDKDLYALLSDRVKMLIDDKLIGPDECAAKFGVWPEQIRDFLAICGDASDNIPGCPGIGAKGAAALLHRHGSLALARAATDEELGLKPKALASLRAWDPSLAVKLTTLITDAPVALSDLFQQQESEADMADMTKIVSRRKNSPLKIVAYGPEGVGKTRFGAFANKPIFLCAENGLSAPDLQDVPSFPVPDNWEDVLAALGWLTTAEHSYRTLVIDSLDWLYKHVKAAIQRRENMTEAEFEAFGRGEKFALAFWVKLNDAFDALQEAKGMHIIVLAHCATETYANPLGEDFARFQLALTKKAADRWKQWPDFLLFMSQEMFTKKNKDDKGAKAKGILGGHRIFTERTAAFDAKNRINLPAEIEYSTANPFTAFSDAVKAAMPKPALPASTTAAASPDTGTAAA